MTRSTDAGISARTTVYAERQMLKHATPVMVLEKIAVTKQMPKNKGTTVKFRRPRTFSPATTPLQNTSNACCAGVPAGSRPTRVTFIFGRLAQDSGRTT